MGHDSNGNRELAILSAAERRLAECTQLDEVLEIRGEAETVRIYAQKQRLGLQLQNHAAQIKIQAERRAGEALAAMRLQGGDRKSKSHRGTLILQLKDLGITRNQSSRWQLEASVSSAQFAAYCQEAENRDREISSSAFRRFIRSRNGVPLRAQSCRKPTGAEVDAKKWPLASSSSGVEESLEELRGHLQLISSMFAAICRRKPQQLETIELREIPRYLREMMARLHEIEQHLKAIDQT
jgi:hypothetical protein